MRPLQVLPADGPGELVAIGAGPDRSVTVAYALEPARFWKTRPNGARSFMTQAPGGQSYLIRTLVGGRTLETTIASEPYNITRVQRLGDDILLVCPRCRRGSATDIDHNGRLYSREGELLGTLVLGDGINDVAVSRSTIWTSYFDEGVFGNYGWGEGGDSRPVGASGLVAWTRGGALLHELELAAGLEPICDCYAMSVDDSGDVWATYYPQFPILRVREGKVVAWWQTSVGGAYAIAVDPPWVVLLGAYRDRARLSVLELESRGVARTVRTIALVGADGQPATIGRSAARADAIFFESNGAVWVVDVTTCVAGSGEAMTV